MSFSYLSFFEVSTTASPLPFFSFLAFSISIIVTFMAFYISNKWVTRQNRRKYLASLVLIKSAVMSHFSESTPALTISKT